MKGDAIVIERHIAAAIDEVFRWWTEPERLREWMSPVGIVEAEVDLRVGGNFRIVMRGDCMVIEHVGTYLDVRPPRRLEFTWISRYTEGKPTLVLVELEPDADNGTLLRLTHRQLPDSAVESHAGGWTAMLDRLESSLPSSSKVARGR